MSGAAGCRAERSSRPIERRSPACAPRWNAPIATGEWWRADVWEPRRDRRIPAKHEPLGNARLRFAGIEQAWLREAIEWFFAAALERGVLAWTSLPGYRTYLGGYFSEFLVQAGIDHPRLADPGSGLRTVALQLLSFLRGRRGRGGRPLSLVSIGLAQTAISTFYLFMADHRHEAAEALGEPRWAELSDAHARLWRAGEFVRRNRSTGPTDFIDPEALGRIVSHLDILALGRDQTKAAMVDGERREVSGRGDPQAMRAFLLEVLSGRRIDEILLIDSEPLIPLPGLDGDAEHDPEAFVARLRYRQTKIGGAPDTILVEREVVNIVTEQQRWLKEHLAAMTPASPPEPQYLFVAWQSNRLGAQPYSANTLRTLLRGLAGELQIRDQHGRLVDFSAPAGCDRLLNGGVPIHVVQRYLGHLSPEMTMRYAARCPRPTSGSSCVSESLAATAARSTWTRATSTRWCSCRATPTGSCPTACACCRRSSAAGAATLLTCDHFATDARHLPELNVQLSETAALIEHRSTHCASEAHRPGDDRRQRVARAAPGRGTLVRAMIAALESAEDGQAVRGAGVAGRAGQPTETTGESEERPGER